MNSLVKKKKKKSEDEVSGESSNTHDLLTHSDHTRLTSVLISDQVAA